MVLLYSSIRAYHEYAFYYHFFRRYSLLDYYTQKKQLKYTFCDHSDDLVIYLHLDLKKISILCMGISPTIIPPGLICNLRILYLKLPIFRQTGLSAISTICLVWTVLSVTNSNIIIVALWIPESISDCYVVHHQSAVYISLYIHLFLLSNWEFSGLSVE